ncbi:hypothetical protein ACWCPQ_34730 [Nocardia sp. NPDC001965]
MKNRLGCYDVDGQRDYESISPKRRDEWMARYRHDLDAALALAQQLAPGLKCWRRTAADVLAEDEANGDMGHEHVRYRL